MSGRKSICEDCGGSGSSPVYDVGGSISGNEPCPSCSDRLRLPHGRARCIVKVAMPDHDLEIAAYVDGSIAKAATFAEEAKQRRTRITTKLRIDERATPIMPCVSALLGR